MARRAWVLALGVALGACGRSEASPASAGSGASGSAVAPARQWIVGVDLSASRTPTQLADGQRLLEGIVEGLGPGDRLVLIRTEQAGRDDAVRFETSLPRLREAGRPTGGEKRRIAEARAGALAVLPVFFDTAASRSIRTTDLFATLYRAADYAKARPGDSTVVLLLSDMLQSTGEMDFERAGGIPSGSWISARQAEGRLPDLRGVCVFAVGADVVSRRGVAAREFWRAYFAASGGRMGESGYRGMVSGVGEVGC